MERSLNLKSILELCRDVPVAAFAKGDTILPERGRTGILYVLIEGDVDIVKGDFTVATVSEPGAIFGEVSVLLDMPHMASVRALTPCRLHCIGDAAAFLRSHPEIALELARLLAQRLNGVTSYLADLKRQFEDQKNHLGMVDEVLETLVHQQRVSFDVGSDRDPDRTI